MLRDSTQTLNINDRAPAFELPTAARKTVRLSDFQGKCLLVIFIRGTWCPNCTRQMDEFESAISEMTKRNVGVVFIAAQKIDGLFKGKRYMEQHPYPFPVLFDESRSVARSYGVRQIAGYDTVNLARRSIFLVDGGGVVRWIAVSPHQWEAPGIQDVIAAIESCGRC